MNIKIWITGLAIAACLGTAEAQNDIYVSGRVITAPYFDAGHRLLFSQGDYIYGTSRSAAMGGAFASLGADLSSMSINPAGLGMYQSSDWGFTQALTIDNMRTTSPFMRSGNLAAGGNRVSYGLNNLGAAYNVYNGSGNLTSLTVGLSYNRAANFNSRTRVETFGEDSSIADMFARQLNLMAGDSQNPIRPGDLDPSANPFENLDIYLDEWGAALGYQTELVVNNGNSYNYFSGALPSDSYFGSVTRGGIYEYNFSVGANLSNIIYLGATVGITEISYREETSYEEFYTSGARFSSMWFDQTTQILGSGLTAKLGLIARPVEALRIGVAFHLPTYYTLEKSYHGAMGTVSDNQNPYRADTGNTLRDQQRFNSAPRLLAGISGIVSDRAIVALDWETAWYDRIRTRDGGTVDIQQSKDESQSLYKPAHTLRAGVEYRLTDAVSLRGGGSWMFDFLRSDAFDPRKSDNPAARSGYSLTAGAGFVLGRNGYLDLAYVHNRTRMTDYDFYFFEDTGNRIIASQYDGAPGNEQLRNYTPTRNRNMITLTLGSRF